MNWEPVDVSLDESCLAAFARRYHFRDDEKKEIYRIYKQLEPRVHACFHFVTIDEAHKIDGRNVNSALVVATLGKAFDEFQNNFLEKGEIESAYICDCLGLELLSIAYDRIDKKLHEITGLYPGGYIFAGSDELPLSDIPKLMAMLGQKQVIYNEAYVLVPKKSVVFKTLLHEKPQNRHSRCETCNAVNCRLRKTQYVRRDARAADEGAESNYNESGEVTIRKDDDNHSGIIHNKGLIHLYTGDGKGKTTAAIGLAVRTAGAGMNVVFAQFMKGRDTSELKALSELNGISIIRADEDYGWFREDDENQRQLYTAAHNRVLDEIERFIDSDKCDVLILDEVTYPYNYGIIDKERLEKIISGRPDYMEVVLTGRNAAEFFYENADYITNMEKQRHPYDNGIKARLGIEY